VREVVIVDSVRVPIGKAGGDKGCYKDVRADELGAMSIRRLLEKNPKLDPGEIEAVVWGYANQTGEQV
jgi:acetyl-CoA acetyltransferase